MTDLETMKSAFDTINIPYVVRTFGEVTYLFLICHSPIDRKALEKATYKQLYTINPSFDFHSTGKLWSYPGCNRDKIMDIVMAQKAKETVDIDTYSPDVIVSK